MPDSPEAKPPRILRRPQAREDIIDQAYYIAENSLDASDRFLSAVEQAFQSLAVMPNMGRIRETENPRLTGVRQWSVRGFEKYLIFYRPLPDGIEVIRVLHGARDIDAILSEE